MNPDPILISRNQARRFLLAHQFLLPPRSLANKEGILRFIKHVGCIQFDPIDIVGRNPDLVLQARVADFQKNQLEELLYSDKQLVEGWDKMASIYPSSDWPFFQRRRNRIHKHYINPEHNLYLTEMDLRERIRTQGAYGAGKGSSNETITWFWGRPVRKERAALEILYEAGEVMIARRSGSRKTYDLPERILPKFLFSVSDPHLKDEDYQDWHILRRIGSVGLVHAGASEFWLGIEDVKSRQRNASLERLLERNAILEVEVVNLPGKRFFIRKVDHSQLEDAAAPSKNEAQAAFLPPLDNLLWDRKLLKWIFDFDYIWEVYKPAALRQYGHYTLPVLYGERFIARTEIIHNKKMACMVMQNWWWEQDVKPNRVMNIAIQKCLDDFSVYLGVDQSIQWKNHG